MYSIILQKLGDLYTSQLLTSFYSIFFVSFEHIFTPFSSAYAVDFDLWVIHLWSAPVWQISDKTAWNNLIVFARNNFGWFCS